jgi:hypothetical protein
MTTKRDAILVYLVAHPGVTLGELAEGIGADPGAALGKLMQAGKVARTGHQVGEFRYRRVA